MLSWTLKDRIVSLAKTFCQDYGSSSTKVKKNSKFHNFWKNRTKLSISKHLCSTSLLTCHSVSACSSEYTWTECNLKYHTHSHPDRKLQETSSKKMLFRLMPILMSPKIDLKHLLWIVTAKRHTRPRALLFLHYLDVW